MKRASSHMVLLLLVTAPAARPLAAVPGVVWWAVQPLVRPAVPRVANGAWACNPIDAFVLSRLEREGLEPAPPASPEALARRACLDVTGLPPSPEELDRLNANGSPSAIHEYVDSLLASPRFGERWGRHWLDVARFAESNGFEYDHLREHAWRYRDYVIDSLNSDKPYSLFIEEQVAGDVLDPVSSEGVIATGFLVSGPWDEAGSLQRSDVMRARAREEELEDMVSVVSQAFLGATANCARCHDHKLDPIPQRDYYRMKSSLEGVRHGNRVALGAADMSRRDASISDLKARRRALGTELAALDDAVRRRLEGEHAAPASTSGPAPIARWTFDSDARDSIGGLDGEARGGAVVSKGRLRLKGKGAYVETRPLGRDLAEKTLEAWVRLARVDQGGGAPISVESPGGAVFDAIAYGERKPLQWVAGSSMFHRTRDLDGPGESAHPDELVHVATTYGRDGTVSVYRNGKPYGAPYNPADGSASAGDGAKEAGLQTYRAGEAHVLLGLRHTGAANGFFAGEIEEACLYDRSLAPDEVARSFAAGAALVPFEKRLAAMTPAERSRRASIESALQGLEEALDAAEAAPMTYAADIGEPSPTSVLLRGDVEKKGELVSAGGLSAVGAPSSDFGLPPSAPEAERRLKLAAWIASRENPLTARVIVNRLWHYHFGRGLVSTPNDFGAQGEPPSHPELLDWLAAELIAQGWSLKAIHRLILDSATYRQSGRFDEKAAARDADDRLLWRFPPRRLEGEAIRDSMLAASGDLRLEMGGPSFRPFTVTVFNSSLYAPIDSDSPELNRRTVYRMCVQSGKDPMLESLDCPDPSVKAPARNVTMTPIQSLVLMNSSFVQRQSLRFAGRIRREAGSQPEQQVERGYRVALGRRPTPPELERAVAFASDEDLVSFCWALLNSSEFQFLR